MPIHFVSGKPGGGKSLYSTWKVIDELRCSRRNIVTNLSLKIPEICAYLHEKDGETFGAAGRITILENEQVCQFWLYYGKGLVLRDKVEVGVGKRVISHVNYSDRNGGLGVLYVLDELHEFFNARKWADTGDDALHYLSQHRKLGDDVICITQSIGNVDKQFRSVAQDFSYIRNHAKEKLPFLGGLVRSVSLFSRSTYLEPFTGAAGQRAMETRTFRLDSSGICSCYDTASGVGILGREADTKSRKPGFSPVWLCVAVAVIVLMVWNGPSAIASLFWGRPKGGAAPEGGAVPSDAPAPIPASSEGIGVPAVAPDLVKSEVVASVPVFLTGIMAFGGKVQVVLSDGRVFRVGDPELEFYAKDFARISGEKYVFAPSFGTVRSAPPGGRFTSASGR